jgi:hypothetical protein
MPETRRVEEVLPGIDCVDPSKNAGPAPCSGAERSGAASHAWRLPDLVAERLLFLTGKLAEPGLFLGALQGPEVSYGPSTSGSAWRRS